MEKQLFPLLPSGIPGQLFEVPLFLLDIEELEEQVGNINFSVQGFYQVMALQTSRLTFREVEDDHWHMRLVNAINIALVLYEQGHSPVDWEYEEIFKRIRTWRNANRLPPTLRVREVANFLEQFSPESVIRKEFDKFQESYSFNNRYEHHVTGPVLDLLAHAGVPQLFNGRVQAYAKMGMLIKKTEKLPKMVLH